MSYISYAQNLEDVMLMRVFGHIQNGFYIDVGAHHPVNNSVTNAFYKMGWRGINIEPSVHYFKLLQRKRPRDINMQVLVGDSVGNRDFYDILSSGYSTTRPEFMQQAVDAGFVSHKRTVACQTLDAICADHKVDAVHFLKIDVEGAESEVIRGFSFINVRPIVLVIEANKPQSQIPNYECWEHHIVTRGYSYVYSDGLNRFYLADEHAFLKSKFDEPPNIFDQYLRPIGIRAFVKLMVAEHPWISGHVEKLLKVTRKFGID